MKEHILKHVLKNALDFHGKANSKVVLGQVLKEHEELKKDVPKLLKEIEQVIKEVEAMPLEKIKEKLEKEFPKLLKEKKEEKVEGMLKPLANAQKGKVVTRIAPSPSGPLHIGHAYGASLNYEYAKMYDGKLLLRIEDTNPENIYPDAYRLIEEDVKWLSDNHVAEVIIQSSRLDIYYSYAEELVKKGKAYVCTCDADQWRVLKAEGTACSCRELPVEGQHARYKKMLKGYAEGEAVLRLKTDIKDKNPAMRDFSLMRVNEHVHPRTGTKYRVWPLMIFSVAIDDYESGVTHVLNGKDHADNAKKEAMIMKCLGWKPPEYSHWGRINFQGMKISTSETRLKIEHKEYTGWDDIRLPFLPALRKRGYQAGAFRKFAAEIGLSLNDKTVAPEEFWKIVNACNKDIVESQADRYFFVDNPIRITVQDAPKKEVMINFHPDFPKRGKRKLAVHGEFLISENDFRTLGEGYLHRLMDYGNFRLKGETFHYVSESYDEFKNSSNKGKIIHWLPPKNNMPVEIMMEDGSISKGLGEETLHNVKEGTIIQLERRFFVRVDKSGKKGMTCWFLHR